MRLHMRPPPPATMVKMAGGECFRRKSRFTIKEHEIQHEVKRKQSTTRTRSLGDTSDQGMEQG